MSYTTELSDDCMGIHHVGKGAVSGAEILDACRATTQLFQNTENFHYEFIDFSEVTELEISADELNRIIAQDFYAATFRPEAVVVLVASREEIFEKVKGWEQRVKGIGWQTHIARDRAEATRWLQEHYPDPDSQGVEGAKMSGAPSDPSARV